MFKKSLLPRLTRFACFAFSVLVIATVGAQAQTTAFTYQGRLSDAANPANGAYQIKFYLFDAAAGGNQVGSTLTFDGAGSNPAAVQVTNGVFTVRLNFGANPLTSGASRYLEISVKKSSDPGYTTLAPRQELTSAPYAVRTLSAGTADSLSSTCVACVTDSQIDSLDGSKLTGTVPNATHATNADNATTAATAGSVTGVVDIANGGTGSATKSFVDLTTDQTIAGNKTFTGALRGDGSGLRNISGASVTGSTALNPQRLAILRWYDVNSATATRAIPVGTFPHSLAFDGTFIYVANSGNNTVMRIRASTGVVEGPPIAAVSSPGEMAFDGTYIYVANILGNTVTRIRASTGVVEGSPIPVGTRPDGIVFDGTFIYVANAFSNDVTRIRASTGVVEGDPIAVGYTPGGMAFDGTFIYVAAAGSGRVERIRATTGSIGADSIEIGPTPSSMVFDGTFVYVGITDNVMRIRASTGMIEGGPIAVGGRPTSMVFDGTFVYVSDPLSNSVVRIRASTGMIEGPPITAGNYPTGMAFDGSFIYVANQTSGTVVRF